MLLVVDPGMVATPWVGEIEASMAAAGLRSLRFEEVESNPRAATVEALAELARGEGATVVVGLGGGSVLDAAKAAAMLARNGGRCADYQGAERFTVAPLPFVALPTTCGTGSEVTWVSVITDPERRTKISVKGHGMFPDHALVDADLLTSLPSRLVAWTGLDALTHALEALTGKPANPASDALATRAVELLLGFLPRAVADVGGDAEARVAVMTASTLAGMAFGNADVGAVHCLSESLGGGWDVPHGLANAILLVPVMRGHGSSVEEVLAGLGRRLLPGPTGGCDDPAAAAELLAAVEQLVMTVGVPPFAELGIPAADFPWIAEQAVANGSNPSNPRPMGTAEYLAILRAL